MLALMFEFVCIFGIPLAIVTHLATETKDKK